VASFPYFNGTGSVYVCIGESTKQRRSPGPPHVLVTKYPWIYGYTVIAILVRCVRDAGGADRDGMPMPADDETGHLQHQALFRRHLVGRVHSSMVVSPDRLHRRLLHPAARRHYDIGHVPVPDVLAYILQTGRPGERCIRPSTVVGIAGYWAHSMGP